ncbi:MAG TPA: PadR family transcriptional regulator [Clostridia bacterium]|nr:PadR family transcriptional regulator [Clostridia bacterium]HPQ47021.1 PadR family transcriptional regulator [Clostridia bacterium]HRX42367.1 PadR family transcriptional regulator [Clostridia bacterium]
MARDTQLLKGLLEGCILSLLEEEVTYGYKIVEKLEDYGFRDPQEATVYPILNRLEKKGLLKSEKRPSEIGPPRKYYMLTDEGHLELGSFMEDWNELKLTADRLLEGRK